MYSKKYRQLDAALSENIDNLQMASSFGHPITMSQSQQKQNLVISITMSHPGPDISITMSQTYP